jgi:hypothetical protein
MHGSFTNDGDSVGVEITGGNLFLQATATQDQCNHRKSHIEQKGHIAHMKYALPLNAGTGK